VSDHLNAIPIAALFGEESTAGPPTGPRRALAQADVIIALDVASQNEWIVFGRDALQQMAKAGRAEAGRLLVVSLDHGAGDLDRLAALVQSLKGGVEGDYRSPSPPPRAY
jgi:hypothetical protein